MVICLSAFSSFLHTITILFIISFYILYVNRKFDKIHCFNILFTLCSFSALCIDFMVFGQDVLLINCSYFYKVNILNLLYNTHMLSEKGGFMYQYIFKRYEKKYILSLEHYHKVLDNISDLTVPDKYGVSDILNIYCDTDDYRIIRASVQKPPYKEKLRLRCYGIPSDNHRCFLELKKKYKRVVYKRRICTNYKTGLSYLSGDEPYLPDSQIKSEIDYFRKFYCNPTPKVNIFYKRTAFFDKNDKNIRFTFDSELRYRECELDLKNGIYGKLILPDDKIIMEIKTLGAMPLWISQMLTKLEIFPVSFSKYGTAYNDMLENNKITIPNGGITNAG